MSGSVSSSASSAPRIFVSHSHRDEAFTQQLVRDLHAAGVEVWVDVAGISHGNFMQRVDEALQRCDWMVLVLTPNAIASKYVRDEVYAALHRVNQGYMRAVIPLLAVTCVPGSIPPQWDVLHRYDATHSYPAALASLLDATRELEVPVAPRVAKPPPSRRTAQKRVRILIGDDEPDIREVLAACLGEAVISYDIVEAKTGQEALDILTGPEDERPSVALLDIHMPRYSGIEILQRMQEQGVDIPVIMMTGMSTASLAIKAIQFGAADYVAKPFEAEELLATIAKVLRIEENKRSADSRLAPQSRVEPSEHIVGSTPNMLQIFKTIGQVARTSASILITGEPGTGKELIAEAIHGASDRRAGPLIKVNCAALPETLLESELFGYEKDAFTGALKQHKGCFEAAHKGTIVLEEVGEIPLGTQKKLLRVLQEKEFERIGGSAPIKVDARVIATTNYSLHEQVAVNRFREDLFYRLNVIAIHVPPLRERLEDLPALVSYFLDKHRYAPSSPPVRIAEEAMEKLLHHEWQGNVGELEYIVARAVVLSRGAVITSDHIVFAN